MDLIRRSQAGDLEAFAGLYHQYKNLVFRTAYLMLDSPEEAEDALQEIFLQVYRSLSAYQPDKAAFSTWLYRITVNHCLNRRRKSRVPLAPLRHNLPDPSLEEFAQQHASEQDNDDLRVSIHRLSEKLRAVVVLRFYWELPYAEIAQILDIPLGTVKSRLDLALKILRRDLAERGLESQPTSEVIK